MKKVKNIEIDLEYFRHYAEWQCQVSNPGVSDAIATSHDEKHKKMFHGSEIHGLIDYGFVAKFKQGNLKQELLNTRCLPLGYRDGVVAVLCSFYDEELPEASRTVVESTVNHVISQLEQNAQNIGSGGGGFVSCDRKEHSLESRGSSYEFQYYRVSMNIWNIAYDEFILDDGLELIQVAPDYFRNYAEWQRKKNDQAVPKSIAAELYAKHEKLLFENIIHHRLDYLFVIKFTQENLKKKVKETKCLPLGITGEVVTVLCSFEGQRLADAAREDVELIIGSVHEPSDQVGLGRMSRPLKFKYYGVSSKVWNAAYEECLDGELLYQSQKEAAKKRQGQSGKDDSIDFIIDDSRKSASDQFVLEAAKKWLLSAINMDASDVHIEPGAHFGCVRLRVDNDLMEIQNDLPLSLYKNMVSWFKNRAGADIMKQNVPLDGKIKLLRKVGGHDSEIDIRFSSIPTVFGEKLVLRLLDKSKGVQQYAGKEALRKVFPQSRSGVGLYHAFVDAVTYNNGIVLVTGPTGCGKTTTLNTVLQHLLAEHGRKKNIVTIEDPVEYTVCGASQVQVNEVTGLTFATALRSILRQDPDIILVGEIRDKETANIAVQASLTGHLILTTLHTNDALGCVPRLKDMGVSPVLIGSTVRMFQAQRLVRRLCIDDDDGEKKIKGCARLQSEDATMERVRHSRLKPYAELFKGMQAWERSDSGCPACNNKSFRGRAAAMELIPMSFELQDAIQKDLPRSEMIRIARSVCGLRSMVECGIDMIGAGLTSISQVEELEVGDGHLIGTIFAEQAVDLQGGFNATV